MSSNFLQLIYTSYLRFLYCQQNGMTLFYKLLRVVSKKIKGRKLYSLPLKLWLGFKLRFLRLFIGCLFFQLVRWCLAKYSIPMKIYLLSMMIFPVQLWAVDLLDIYQQAIDNDPIFKKAYSTYMSKKEAIPQAMAALFPQLTLNAQAGRNVTKVNGTGLASQQGIADTYNSNQWQIVASQAIFNYQAWSQIKQARASVKAAQAVFNNAAQELMLRTANAYFQVLLSKDTLNFAEAKKRANKRQLDQAQQRFQVGVATITSVYEAKAAYDQSVALVIAAKNNQINQNENLQNLTNHVYEYLAPLRDSRIPLIKPEPNKVEEWVNTSIRQNYNLFAAKYNLESSRENIKSQAANSWPVFSILGTSTGTQNTERNATVFVPRNQINSVLAITMSFPILQGGLVESQVRQAQYDFQTSSQNYEQIYRNLIVNSRIAFNTIVDGISKVKADRQTIISQQNSLNSTAAQFEVGTRTMVDVVNAQRSLFEAQQQLASDQYNLINSILNLKYLAGTLNVNDLVEINSWLKTTRINGFPSFKVS